VQGSQTGKTEKFSFCHKVSQTINNRFAWPSNPLLSVICPISNNIAEAIGSNRKLSRQSLYINLSNHLLCILATDICISMASTPVFVIPQVVPWCVVKLWCFFEESLLLHLIKNYVCKLALQKCMTADIPKVVEVGTAQHRKINGNIVVQEKPLVEKCQAAVHSIHEPFCCKQQSSNRTTMIVGHEPNNLDKEVLQQKLFFQVIFWEWEWNHTILSRMMNGDELMHSWNQETHMVNVLKS